MRKGDGVRFTIHRQNHHEIGSVFDIMREHDIDRVCFYHLVYAGRGSNMMDLDLTHDQTCAAVRLIMDRTRAWFDEGGTPEVLTVNNHADAPFLYLELLREDPRKNASRAGRAHRTDGGALRPTRARARFGEGI